MGFCEGLEWKSAFRCARPASFTKVLTLSPALVKQKARRLIVQIPSCGTEVAVGSGRGHEWDHPLLVAEGRCSAGPSAPGRGP